MQMRVLVLGGDNALGQALIRQGAQEQLHFEVPCPPEQGWDAASLTVLIDESRPDAVVNLAFYHDWFQAEGLCAERSAAQLSAVERLAGLCQHYGAVLLQPSNYRVFDGARATAYSEKDEPSPLCERGHLMCQLEQQVRASCPRHVLLRFGWLMDESPDGVMGRFLQRVERLGALPMADDRRGNATPVDDAARVILAVAKQLDCQAPLWGTYHYGGQEASTPVALAQAALIEARRYRENLLDPIPTAHAACPDAKVEPLHAVLSCKKILHTFGIKPRAWRSGVPSLLERYYRQ